MVLEPTNLLQSCSNGSPQAMKLLMGTSGQIIQVFPVNVDTGLSQHHMALERFKNVASLCSPAQVHIGSIPEAPEIWIPPHYWNTAVDLTLSNLEGFDCTDLEGFHCTDLEGFHCTDLEGFDCTNLEGFDCTDKFKKQQQLMQEQFSILSWRAKVLGGS